MEWTTGENLSEQIARVLLASLVSGQLVPGVTYSVPSLAEQFGVSVMPVREAMLTLVQQGLMTPVRNRGFRVVELTPRELDDILQLRLMLEVPGTVEAAGHVTDRTMRDLRRLAREIARHARNGNLLDYIEADRRFHGTLIALAGNTRLAAIVDDLRARARLTALDSLAEHGDLEGSAHEHLEILDAIAAGDEQRVRALMDRHIRHTRGIWAGLSEETRA